MLALVAGDQSSCPGCGLDAVKERASGAEHRFENVTLVTLLIVVPVVQCAKISKGCQSSPLVIYLGSLFSVFVSFSW